ncbi:DNA replication protein DnaC, partial [Staphylococcus simulans]
MRRLLNPQIKHKLKQYEPTNIEYGLFCEKCGKKYDLHKFDSGYEFKDGCECSMIEAGKQAEKQRKQKAVNQIFRQS